MLVFKSYLIFGTKESKFLSDIESLFVLPCTKIQQYGEENNKILNMNVNKNNCNRLPNAPHSFLLIKYPD